MWLLDNQTPYLAQRTWVRNKEGAAQWVIVVKAVYDIGSNGKTVLSQEQLAPLLAPEYSGEEGKSSIVYDADLTAMKPSTDILINASAHVSGGKKATKVEVAFRLNEIQKRLVVRGDRIWENGISGLTPGYSLPFMTMPIVYERAYGGIDQTDLDPQNHRMDPTNPFGTGVSCNPHKLLGTPAPNIEYTSGNLAKNGPAGFGPIPSYCSPRIEYGGTYDAHWEKNKKPLLPDDWNPKCLLCSPLDQRPSKYLRGGEIAELYNLTPNGRLVFPLPKVYLTFETFFGSKSIQHRSKLVTVIIEPDHPRIILAWQTSLDVGPQDVDYLDKTIIKEKEYKDLS